MILTKEEILFKYVEFENKTIEQQLKEAILKAMEEYAVQRLEVAETLNTYCTETEKYKKELLTEFLQWIDIFRVKNPTLETTNEDIAEMFLQSKK